MRYYEIVFMIYPDKDSLIDSIVDHYVIYIKNNNGKIYRLENWGIRYLAYSIKNIYKAYYILMNIKINKDFIKLLNDNLRVNSSILRFIIIKKKRNEVEKSIIMSKNLDTDIKKN